MDLLCLDLLNTRPPSAGPAQADPLTDEAWRVRWAKKRNLPLQVLIQESASSALIRLRSQLRGMVGKLMAGEELDQADEQLLNHYLQQSHQIRVMTRQDDHYEMKTLPAVQDLDWLLAEIVASFVGLLADRRAGRIKVCANPDCQWLFYDESRGGTRRWCDDSCGNLMKVRRFRERQRNKQA